MLEYFYSQSDSNPIWSKLKGRGYLKLNAKVDKGHCMMANLPPILRTLLITDGTVTRSLEAYFWEPISIQQVSLKTVTAQKAIKGLHSEKGEPLLIREVKLVGEASQKVYTTAFSIIRLKKIPADIRTQLEQGGIGIGVLISQFSVESYREILDIGHTNNLSFDDETLECNTQSHITYRSYRIMVKKEPAILITEKFPKAIYQ